MTQAEQAIDFIEVDPDGNPYFCDWYACLVDDTPENIMEALDRPMKMGQVKPCSGVPQYDRSLALMSEMFSDRPMFELSHGGNQGASPHLVSKGYVAHQGMSVLRRTFPAHRVSRMDIAVDLKPTQAGQDLYGTISAILHELHELHGLKTRTINHDVPAMGRTHYLGSRESTAMVRLYEKDKEQASKGLPYIPGNVRLELEIKPQKRLDRAQWATVGLKEAWGATRWTKTLADRVLSLDAQAIRRAPAMKRTDEETWQQIINMHLKLAMRLDERAVEMLRKAIAEGKAGLDQDVREAATA